MPGINSCVAYKAHVINLAMGATWGAHAVNRFADVYNKQIHRFNLRFWSPEAEAVDTFIYIYVTGMWKTTGGAQCCPPVYLIPRIILHTKKINAYSSLITPCWHSAPFWSILYLSGVSQAEFMRSWSYPSKRTIHVKVFPIQKY